MSRDFWLGVAATPAAAIAAVAVWFALRHLNRAGAWLVNRLSWHSDKRAAKRAAIGAVMACARRSWWLPLPSDAVLILAVGHDTTQAEEIRRAIRNVITPPPRVRVPDKPPMEG
jgi:hypothetical protein